MERSRKTVRILAPIRQHYQTCSPRSRRIDHDHLTPIPLLLLVRLRVRAFLCLHSLYLLTLPMKEPSQAHRPAGKHAPTGAPLTDSAPAHALPDEMRRANVPIDALIQLRRRFLLFIRARVRDAETAEDILQMAYLRALSTTSSLQDEESAVAWFYRILRNAIIDLYRSRGSEATARERWASEQSEAQSEVELRRTVCLCIEAALESLSPGYAQILREVDLEGAKLANYASAHGITVGNAAVRIYRARASLKKRLILCCGSCALHRCVNCSCRD